MNVSTRTMTADELFMMPHDGFRYELVKGELVKMSPTGGKHGILTSRIGIALGRYVEENALGETFGAETGFILATNPDTVRAPDAAFVSRERIPPGDITEKFWPGAPDLAVEVISPGDTLYEVDEKIEEYLEAGVRLVWIVNPKKRTVTIYQPGEQPQTLTEEETLDRRDVVPGFQYSLARLFAGSR
ncbi:MAG TPA: Uma2 family endonuclease [Pyrinomonadaceae bacterium]|nr:Uma2 family endonuclease [Pyrinomonadaceae bacterium]